jgi:hypothetical protein
MSAFIFFISLGDSIVLIRVQRTFSEKLISDTLVC